MRHLIIFVVLLSSIIYLLSPFQAHATNLSLSISVGDTSFTITGTTSPLTHLTLSENNAVLGTMEADSLGFFTQTLHFQDPGLHDYVISATDTNNQTIATTYHISLTAGDETTLSWIYLTFPSPTPIPSPTTEPSTSAAPSPSLAATTSTLPIPRASLSPAEAALNVVLTIFTPTHDLELTVENLVPVVTRWIDLWQASFQAQALDNPTTSKKAGSCDLNGDHTCTLTDLSILLYYIKPTQR